MTDVPPPGPVTPPVVAGPPLGGEVDARTYMLIIYGLYIGAVVCGGATGLVGVVMAYIKRAEFRGTIWESHIENAIHAFWVWFILFVVGVVTAWFIVGIFVIGAAFIYFLYRTIKGLIAALDGRPYV